MPRGLLPTAISRMISFVDVSITNTDEPGSESFPDAVT
jgi:hypothetical protein